MVRLDDELDEPSSGTGEAPVLPRGKNILEIAGVGPRMSDPLCDHSRI